MYCRKCGAENSDNAYRCTRCGEQLHGLSGGAPVKHIPNYLVQSILVTIFCCLPLGIPAIVFSAQVNAKVQAGDIDGAIASSNRAKVWGWWSFGIGFLFVMFWVGMTFLGALAGA
jgi:hypothetical protein